jgi:hypothetical protein
MMPEQLAFPFFIGEPEPVLPRPSRYRRRLARVAAIALELGQRQGKRRAIPQQRLATAQALTETGSIPAETGSSAAGRCDGIDYAVCFRAGNHDGND